jgi:ech hydrogenase subunit A
MVLVIGIVGPLICIQAVGYMRDYHRASPMVRGRRTVFFALLFVFLGSMFGLVVANDLPMLLVFWEMTTLCSFLLIGYTRTDETIGYAFRALNMNMLGGVAFSVAILFLAGEKDGLDLARLTSGPASGVLVPAIALLALAGLTKSAQMPFSDWLLGAMYAPTPTSALLHSSTMVKAGVFLLLRLSPAMSGSLTGTLVSVVGMFTFLFVSLVAVTEQNVKMVLAYSTIGYLGLITGCAGVGTPQAVWVGVMIVIFHAIAKGLIFLVVGTVENRLYTKDVELFDVLLSRLPRVSVLALAGIAGMFIAPFGIVVAKWAAIRAFLQVGGWEGATFVIILAFASALTIFYWGKLLIKVLSMREVPAGELAIESRVSSYEWFAEGVLAVGVVVVAALLGILSDHVVGPFANSVFPASPDAVEPISWVVIAVMLLAVLFLPVLALWVEKRKDYDEADFYASGRSASADRVMGAALGGKHSVSLRGYYLDGVVNGGLVFKAGTAACGLTLVAMTLIGLVAR